jgi:hypothetical protein
MDAEQFDRLARTLVARRTVMRTLLGGAIGAGLGWAESAGARNRHQVGNDAKKRPNQRKGKGRKGKKNRKGNQPRQNLNPPAAGCGQCPPGTFCDGNACRPCDVCANGCTHRSVQPAIDAAPLGGTIRICPGEYTGDLVITQSVTLIGAGDGDSPADSTILKGGGHVVLLIDQGDDVTLQDLRISGGNGVGGGGIYNNAGTLKLTRGTVTGNSARNFGGGIYNEIGSMLILTDSSVTTNTAGDDGGGIYNNHGFVTLITSTVSDNEADDGGGIYTNSASVVTLRDSDVINNRATVGQGGGIFNHGGEVRLRDGSRVIQNSPASCVGTAAFDDPAGACAAAG